MTHEAQTYFSSSVRSSTSSYIEALEPFHGYSWSTRPALNSDSSKKSSSPSSDNSSDTSSSSVKTCVSFSSSESVSSSSCSSNSSGFDFNSLIMFEI